MNDGPIRRDQHKHLDIGYSLLVVGYSKGEKVGGKKNR